MRVRWFSTFTVIGVLLLALGVFALVLQLLGKHFVFDPGQPPPANGPDRTSWYYIVIGILMIINGLVTPALLPGETPDHQSRNKQRNR
jgi:uncharacterized membrane protein